MGIGEQHCGGLALVTLYLGDALPWRRFILAILPLGDALPWRRFLLATPYVDFDLDVEFDFVNTQNNDGYGTIFICPFQPLLTYLSVLVVCVGKGLEQDKFLCT